MSAVRLPPLNSLRAFEAAARHGSFARAAEELHVSPGAISRHVKLLEEHLAAPLFRRLPRGLELTPAAHGLLPRISAAFEMIAEAVQETTGPTRAVKIICSNTLANRWLVPRLGDFKKLHPELQVSVGVFRATVDELYRGNYDVGLICQRDQAVKPNMDGVMIRRERLTPICAPALLEGKDPIREPADLKNHVLLHPDHDTEDWRAWLAKAGLSAVIDHRQGQTYETMELSVRAAVEGLGVAIADLQFVLDEIASGALVAPFESIVGDDYGYLLVCERGRLAEPGIAVLRDWLIAEAKRDELSLGQQPPAKPAARRTARAAH